MTSTFSTAFSLSLDDSVAFAQLSGDYNPLHVDPIAARRIRFGGTVTHGIHLFLRALDELAMQRVFDAQEPAALSATFDNAALTGTTVNLRASVDGSKVRLSAEASGRAVLSGTVELQGVLGTEPKIEDAQFAPARPQDVDFPPQAGEGTVPVKLRTTLLAALFPSLCTMQNTRWIADLLATTQLVGMRCPGMHSIYSSFKLRRARQSGNSAATLHYQINGMEKRFHLLRIQVNGSCLGGTVEAFFRPGPVAQRPMEALAALVQPSDFAGHRALVVGGSRGLGELTAKILAAGGADVTFTYARGKEDAERICTEMRALGRSSTAHQMDVSAGMQTAPEWLARSQFSHVYFFASPQISKNPGKWDDALFRQFAQVYVTAFAALVEHTLAARADRDRLVSFLYPSSVFVTQPEAGFSEYSVAKAAGEALCDQLQGRRGARFVKPRLPRMRTDQTNSLVDTGAVDPLPVMLEVIRSLHSLADDRSASSFLLDRHGMAHS